MNDRGGNLDSRDLLQISKTVCVFVGVRDGQETDTLDQRKRVSKTALNDQPGDLVAGAVGDLQRGGTAQRPTMYSLPA